MDVGIAGKIAGHPLPVNVPAKPPGGERADDAHPASVGAGDSVHLSTAAETRERSPVTIVKKAAVIGAGIATGMAVAAAGAVAVGALTGIAASLVISAMPQLQIGPELAQALNALLAGGVTGGKLLAAAGGAVAGGIIGNEAMHTDAKIKPAESDVKAEGLVKNIGKYFKDKLNEAKEFVHEAGADLKLGVSDVKESGSLFEAIKAGANTGALYGGAVGSVGGGIEGATVGLALGTIAGLPVIALTGKLPSVLPVSLLGAAAGSRVGSPVGSLAGAIVGGATGALGGAIYYAGKAIGGLFS